MISSIKNNSPIDEISQLIDKNSLNTIKFRQEISSNNIQNNETLIPTNQYLNNLLLDFKSMNQSLDKIKTTNIRNNQINQNLQNKNNELSLTIENLKNKIFSLETNLLNANHQIQDLTLLNKNHENYISELTNQLNINKDKPYLKPYSVKCNCPNCQSYVNYNGNFCPIENNSIELEMNSTGRSTLHDKSNKKGDKDIIHIRDNSDNVNLTENEINNNKKLEKPQFNNQYIASLTENNNIRNNNNNNNNSNSNMKKSKNENPNFNTNESINFSNNMIINHQETNNNQNKNSNNNNGKEKNNVLQSINDIIISNNNIESGIENSINELSENNNIKNPNILKSKNPPLKNNNINNENELENNNIKKQNLSSEKDENEEKKEKEIIEIKNKISRIQKIIETCQKNESLSNILKIKYGDDFIDKLTSGEISEENLIEIENKIEEINENEINNLKISNNNISKNSSFQMRKKYKLNNFPKKKFKNFQDNDNYNKMQLKKQITDHQYHYREFPGGWKSSKDYFTNNNSGGKIEKYNMKITNYPK